MGVINLTPEVVKIVDIKGNTVRKYPSMGKAYVEFEDTKISLADGLVPVFMRRYGKTHALPSRPELGTFYIVSEELANAYKGSRNDLVVTNEPVTLDDGSIGYKSFRMIL